MSKAALVQMTKSMALEWGRHGINVTAICPGPISVGIDEPDASESRASINTLPRRRLARPENLDGLLLLLAADESQFINGAIIPADDGLSVQ
jgi:NAD(P)-dependent dehydrogenase (short-subunit alcohol dehydrogenase family)